jgi:hypothetical protein
MKEARRRLIDEFQDTRMAVDGLTRDLKDERHET